MFGISGFMPHGHCYLWNPRLVVPMAASDLTIGLSYLSISVSLCYLVHRIKLPFHRIFVAFGLFIAACGAGHFVDVLTIWVPEYWLSAAIRVVTAVASVATAVAIYPLIPRIVATVTELAHSENRRRMLDLMIKGAEDYAVFMLDPMGIVTSWNTGAENLTGYRESEIIGKPYSVFYPPEDVSGGAPELSLKRAETDGHFAGEGWRAKKDGTLYYASFQLIALKDGDGRLRGFAKITHDLTLNKKSQDELERRVRDRTEQLEQSREEYQEMVNTVDGIVWEADVGQPKYTFVSRQAERLLGYPIERWLGEVGFWKSIVHPEDLGKISGEKYRSAAEKKDTRTEYRMVTADGRTLWVRDYIRVIYSGGAPAKMRGIMVDITEQKKIEENFRRAQATALRAANVKSEFLTNMSHEIRTPLNAILGMASIVLDGEVRDDQRECLTTIKTAADSLLSLVNDILDFSKFEAEKVELEISDFNLMTLTRNALEVIGPIAMGKSIELESRIDPKVPKNVRGDPGRLLQIFLNLLGNAVKFTPEKGKVTLSILAAEGAGDQIRFEVSDTGVGIAREAIPRLFNPFTQADSSTSRKYGGTGLGLSICKRMVDLMKGRIGVESELGKGTTFWFQLDLPGAQEPVLETEPPVPGESRVGKLRILVAEDNPANRKVVIRLLEKLGHQAEVVANGKEALAIYQGGHFDLVLMDCQMPEMDGYEATRKMRDLQRKDGVRVPVIAFTAHALSGEKSKCMDAGMDDYLSKPVTLKQLEGAIAKWSAPAIDRKHFFGLEELQLEGEPDIFDELMGCFESAGAEKMKAIAKGIEAGDLDAVRGAAHYFKSTCHNLGARKLAGICARIEDFAAASKDGSGDLGPLRNLSQEMRREFDVADRELKGLLRERGRPG